MLAKVKKFFNIKGQFKLEWNDFRCFLTVINVFLIMTVGFEVAWFGLAISLLGFIKDLTMKNERRVNSTLMHLSTIILNAYFVYLNYAG